MRGVLNYTWRLLVQRREVGRLHSFPTSSRQAGEGADAVGFRSRGIVLPACGRQASRPLTPLTAPDLQRAPGRPFEPEPQRSPPATRFPFPLPPRPIGGKKDKTKGI